MNSYIEHLIILFKDMGTYNLFPIDKTNFYFCVKTNLILNGFGFNFGE